MSPWIVLVWIVLAALYAALCGAAWFIGSLLGWPGWAAPAAGAGIVALALLFALIRKWAARADAPLPAAPGMQAVTPAMAALLPPRELAKRWADFLPLLGGGSGGGKRAPLFLALGEDDALRRRLWLSAPECRVLRDDASGLLFAVLPDSLWIDVPAAFLAPPPGAAGRPAASAGSPGLWEELTAFLPRVGVPQGVLAFVDAVADAEAAAGNARWLAGKLDRLYAQCRKHPPALWIVSARLERFPGGELLLEKIAASGDGGRALLGDALGAAARPRAKIGENAFAALVGALDERLDDFLRACDAGGQNDSLSPELHLLRHSLPALTRNAGTLCAALAKSGRAKAAALGGAFLCGGGERAGGSDGLAFAAALPRRVLPGAARREERGRRGGAARALAWAFLFAAAAGLGVLYFQARRVVDALPFALLESSPNPGGFGGPPPVERYARARSGLDGLARSSSLARAVFSAPDRGLARAEERFADSLRSWLPAVDDPARADAWLEGLAEWAEGQRGVDAAVFSTLAGAEVARIRGAHGGAGRARAAGLLDAWRALPDGIARREIDRLQARYDERLREDWLRKGRAVLDAVLGADAPDALPRTKDFLASDPGFLFAAKAGEEMERGGLKDAAWTKPALAAAAAHRAAVMLGTEAPALARLRAAGQTAQSLLGADAPKETAETLDKLSAAAKRLNAHRAVLAALHPRSGDGAALAELAAELYAPPGGKEPPPSLADAESAWESLEAALRALEPAFAEPEGKDILALLKSRQTLLHRAALAHAAARVDAEWDALVFQPFAALEGDGALLHLLDGNPPGAFAKGFARHFLVSREGRRRAATALGIAFPFLPEALDWLDDASARIAELEREYPVTLDLLPVTAGKGARVFPRGIRFTLRGGKAPVSALGYNHKASLSFTWSARASSGAEVEIPFDSAVLRKAWPGALGFVRFLQSLDGERLFLPPEAFPDFPDDLRRGGVEGVTAHVAVTDPGGAAGLRTEALKPPAKAVRTEP